MDARGMNAPAGLAVNDEVASRDFKYYIFDWDDNILHMPTKIYLERRSSSGVWESVSVSTSSFAVLRKDTENWRLPRDGGYDAAFRDFRDDPTCDDDELTFLRDTRAALRRVKEGEKPGPSFNTLRKTLREGRLFAVVTARGHASSTIREAVKIFIEEVLTDDERAEMMANLRGYRRWLDGIENFGSDEEELDYYLGVCRYHAVTGPDFADLLRADPDFSLRYDSAPRTLKPELAKEFAIRGFVEHLFHTLERTGGLGLRHVSVGFSDDDAGNVAAVSQYIRDELVKRFGSFKFVVYDTSDPSLDNGQKVTVAGQLNLPGF